ncbi:MAG: hypothetical protein ACUVS7_09565, partial [Bryobacteraceae bacterium]
TLTAAQVSTATTVQLTASLNGSSKTASVTAEPQSSEPSPGLLKRIARLPSHVRAPGSFTFSVELEAPAPAGGVLIGLSSTKSFVRLPPSVIVPPGARSLQVDGRVDAGAPNSIVYLKASSSNTVATYLVVRTPR